MIPMIDRSGSGMMAMHLVVDPAAFGLLVGLFGAVAWVVAGMARELRGGTAVVRGPGAGVRGRLSDPMDAVTLPVRRAGDPGPRAPGEPERVVRRAPRATLAPVGQEALRRVRRRRLGRAGAPRSIRRTRAGSCRTTTRSAPPRGTARCRRATRARLGLHLIATPGEARHRVRARAEAGPPRVRVDAARRRARVPLRLPRGDRGGAALAHVSRAAASASASTCPASAGSIGSARAAWRGSGARFPELFFLFVLGGEEPIDHAQRETLRGGRDVHPLLPRVMQIHVTEEARHICFAREYLRQHVPALPAPAARSLAVQAPLLLADMTRQMMRPSRHVVRTYGMPRAVVDEAYRGTRSIARSSRSRSNVRRLCVELGLVRGAGGRTVAPPGHLA